LFADLGALQVPHNIFAPSELSLFDVDALEIARQLTILDSRSYQAIQPSELLNLAWSKAKLRHRASNIISMTVRAPCCMRSPVSRRGRGWGRSGSIACPGGCRHAS
jgi:hypothetical protein